MSTAYSENPEKFHSPWLCDPEVIGLGLEVSESDSQDLLLPCAP